jgi:peptidoglycan/xylan/chitin deacetylase (PgdA/CDA1 family)
MRLASYLVNRTLHRNDKRLYGFCMHGICTPAELVSCLEIGDRYTIGLEQLESFIDYLARRTEILAEHQLGRASDRRASLLTFDDGYQNFFRHAYPVLRKRRLPSVIFLPTRFVLEREPLWNDKIAYAIQETDCVSLEFSHADEAFHLPLQSQDEKRAAFQTILGYFNTGCEALTRDAGIESLGKCLAVELDAESVFSVERYRPLEVDEISSMLAEGLVSVGSHSVNHFCFECCDQSTILRELKDSKEQLEATLNVQIASHALPGGFWTPDVEELARRVGYESLFTCKAKPNALPTNDLFLHRYCVTNDRSLEQSAPLLI